MFRIHVCSWAQAQTKTQMVLVVTIYYQEKRTFETYYHLVQELGFRYEEFEY